MCVLSLTTSIDYFSYFILLFSSVMMNYLSSLSHFRGSPALSVADFLVVFFFLNAEAKGCKSGLNWQSETAAGMGDVTNKRKLKIKRKFNTVKPGFCLFGFYVLLSGRG